MSRKHIQCRATCAICGRQWDSYIKEPQDYCQKCRLRLALNAKTHGTPGAYRSEEEWHLRIAFRVPEFTDDYLTAMARLTGNARCLCGAACLPGWSTCGTCEAFDGVGAEEETPRKEQR